MQRKVMLLIALVGCLLANGLVAQTESLNNAGIVELHKLGLGEGVIVEKIKSTRGTYDTSINALKELKAAGVSDEVVRTMIATASSGQVSGGQSMAESHDPKAPHEAGIWFFEEKDGKPRMSRMEPSVYSQVKAGVAFFAAYGQTAKSEAVLRPAHATITTDNRLPVFYFYFDQAQGSLSNPGSVTSPNEFMLAEFKVDERNKLRKLVVGQHNLYAGSQIGPEDKSVRQVTSERIAPGIYKVTPKEELLSGEYGFFYAGTQSFGPFVAANVSGGKIFDFSVKGSPETEPKASKKKSSSTTPKKY